MNEQEKYDWMVYVSCMTFNQAQYIEDAMNGFTMQETNFPFVCAVVDDASTDGEPEVIRKYLLENFDLEDKNVVRHEETDDYVLTFARHKTNLNCYFAVLYLKYNHYRKKAKAPYLAQWREKAKYIAICEGDDYWINPLKLQKQVEFLEQNPDYGLVHSLFDYVNTKSEIIPPPDSTLYKDMANRIKDGYIWHYQLTELNFILTCTVLYRSELVTGEKTYLDFGLYAMLARQQKVFCIKEIMSCYRINPDGMMRSQQYMIIKKIILAKLINLYYYAKRIYPVNDFYYSNKEVYKRIAQATIQCVSGYRHIDSDNKVNMILCILFGIKTNYYYLFPEIFKKVILKISRKFIKK